MEPQSQVEQEMLEEAVVPREKDTELPRNVTEAVPLVASPQRVVPEENFPAIGQESIIHQENSLEYQEITVQNHPSEIGQNMVEPEGLSPNMCQETAVAKALPSQTSEGTADQEGCSFATYLEPDVFKGYVLETDQKRAEPKEYNSEPGQGRAETENILPKTQEITGPKDRSTKPYHEIVEPEHFSQKAYNEIAMPTVLSNKTIQETYVPEEYPPELYQGTPGSEEHSPEIYQEKPGPEDYAPEIYQETPEPEDLSTKTYKNKDVPKECFPEPYQETGRPQGQDPEAHQEDAKDVYTFPQEVKEKPKAQEPEMPAILNVPQESHSENDVYSYVLF